MGFERFERLGIPSAPPPAWLVAFKRQRFDLLWSVRLRSNLKLSIGRRVVVVEAAVHIARAAVLVLKHRREVVLLVVGHEAIPPKRVIRHLPATMRRDAVKLASLSQKEGEDAHLFVSV